jgi:hypothetical protein
MQCCKRSRWLPLSITNGEFLDEELFEEIIKGNGSIPVIDSINNCSVTIIKTT